MEPTDAAAEILELFADPPRDSAIPGAVIIALDGRSGAGKTTVSREIIRRNPRVQLLQIEDFYQGWSGLAGGPERLVDQVLRPWQLGRVARARVWDWERVGWHREVRNLQMSSAGLILIEGVGSGALEIDPFLSAIVWLEAPVPLRFDRAMRREAETFRPFWAMWAQQEEVLLRKSRTPERADLLICQ